MRFTAHTFGSLIPALTIAALAALATNSASAAESKVNIPFNFVASGKICPAGSYTVAPALGGDAVTLKGAGHNFTWLLFPGNPAPSDKRIIVSFDHMGSGYMLRGVQYKSQVTVRLDKRVKETIPTADQVVIGQ